MVRGKCQCGRKASATWRLNLCADGGRKRVLRLCAVCDVALNLHVLTLLGDPRRGEKMKRYAARELVGDA